MRKLFILSIQIALVLVASYFIYDYTIDNQKQEIKLEPLKITLTDLYIYGGKFKLEGEIDKELNKVSLVWYENIIKKEEAVKIKKQEGKTYLYIDDKINKGINIDDLMFGKYQVFLKEKSKDGQTKYYAFENSNLEDLEYYPMHKNYKMKICSSKKGLNFFVETTKESIYDIIIVPGHGGIDSGAVNGDITEAEQVLEISEMIKEQLQIAGYRVKLTKEPDSKIDRIRDPYDSYGEVTQVYNSHAKYLFSIHLNSFEEENTLNGLEIYVPKNMNLTLARSLVKNITSYAQTTTSTNKSNTKIEDGIYFRSLVENEPYYYILRETGGLITGAIADGTTGYSKSLFYNSRVGVESYLLELGYINHDIDLDNILNNKLGYVKGIVEAIKENIK